MGTGNVENRGRQIVGMLGGPTGSGKTAVALEVASALGLEILSCDSGQSRQGLAIGTAAPTSEEQRRIRHHLVGCLAPDAPDSVAAWLERVESILATPGPDLLAVGGTGQYLLGLAKGLDPVPAPDPELRARLQSRWEQEGREPLWKELVALDPTPPHDAWQNPVRLLRALEKALLLSRGATAKGHAPLAPLAKIFALALDRAALQRRLESRLDKMLQEGWIQEIRALETLPLDAPCWKCIGYPELREVAHLDHVPAPTRQRIVDATRQYAKRQETWLRNKLHPTWVPADRPVAEIASEIVTTLREANP